MTLPQCEACRTFVKTASILGDSFSHDIHEHEGDFRILLSPSKKNENSRVYIYIVARYMSL
jgi:hypothetical protein